MGLASPDAPAGGGAGFGGVTHDTADGFASGSDAGVTRRASGSDDTGSGRASGSAAGETTAGAAATGMVLEVAEVDPESGFEA